MSTTVEDNDDNKSLFPHVSHPTQLPLSPASATMPRQKSLRILTSSSTPDIPIPPSLRHSPYLTRSSVFSQSPSSPSLPSEEDERWLQDTIPIAPTPPTNSNSWKPVATEGGLASGWGSMDRRGSIIQLSRRATQKTGRDSDHVKVAATTGLGLGVITTTTTGATRPESLAPPSLLLVPDAHRPTSKERGRSLTFNRRRWSTSPRRPIIPFNSAEGVSFTFPRN